MYMQHLFYTSADPCCLYLHLCSTSLPPLPLSLSHRNRRLSTHLVYRGASDALKSQIWRYSFPAVGLAIAFMFAGRVAARIVTRWRLVVRDEVYLIGERLHNFGEKRAPQARLDAGGPSGAGAQTPPVAVVEGN